MTKIYKDENIVTGNTQKYKPNQTNFRHPVHTHLFKRFDTPVKGYGVSCTNILFVLLGFKTWTQNPSDFTSAGSIRNGLHGKGGGGQVISYYNLIINEQLDYELKVSMGQDSR